MNEREKMLNGDLYNATDPDLRKRFLKSKELTAQFNNSAPTETQLRKTTLKTLLGKTGNKYYIEPPFRCDYGENIYIGNNFYANYNLIIIDVCDVHIGDNVMFGPNVAIYTATHPIDPGVRNRGLELGKPITIKDNVWIGGNTVINPGVTIGENTIIGSGAVITKDMPSNVIAAGNPCKVIRAITEEDKVYSETKEKAYY